MIYSQARATLLAIISFCFFPLSLHASYILQDNILKPQAVQMIEEIGDELFQKTGVRSYLIATNEAFPEKFNFVEYTQYFESNMTKPYVVFVFAPYAIIRPDIEDRGRVGFIACCDEIKKLYDYEAVRDATVDIIAVKDNNSPEDKHNIGVLQGYSTLADQIASSEGIVMTKTIPDGTSLVITILEILVYIGTIFVIWIFFIRPFMQRRKKYGKQ